MAAISRKCQLLVCCLSYSVYHESSSPDRLSLTGQSLRARKWWAGAAELDAMPVRTIATSAIVRMDMSQVNGLTTSR